MARLKSRSYEFTGKEVNFILNCDIQYLCGTLGSDAPMQTIAHRGKIASTICFRHATWRSYSQRMELDMTQQAQPITNEFDAAKVIVETLKGLDKQQQARAIKFACESLEIQSSVTGAASAAGGTTPLGASATPTAQDIEQFTLAKAPKTDQQFAAVVAYFYRFHAPEDQRKDSIGKDDLIEAARLANRKRPHRITLNNAKNAGYLDSAGHGKFKINTVGENLVAVTLPSGGAEGAGSNHGNRRRKPKKKVRVDKAGKGGK